MFPPTGDQQALDQTIQHVSIPPAHAVAEPTPGAPLTLDEDDVSDAQLAAMQNSFFGRGPAPVPAQPQAAPVPVQPNPTHEFPAVRYRPQNQAEFEALTTAKATGVSVMDLIFPQSAPVAAAAPPVIPAAPVPPVVAAPPLEAAPVAAQPTPPPVAPVAPAEDPDVAAAKAALEAAIAADVELKRIARDEPWNVTAEFDVRQAQAVADLSAAGARKALAEQQAAARVSAAAEQAQQAKQAEVDAYVTQQFEQISAQIPQWASQDRTNPFVQAREKAYADLVAAKDPMLQSPDWQRHLLSVVLARTGGVPTSAPVPASVAVFNPPAYAGVGAPVQGPPKSADQYEAEDLAAEQYDPYGLAYGQRRIRVS